MNASRKLETIANVAIVVASVALLTSVYKDRQRDIKPRRPEIAIGAAVPIRDVDWAANQKTLVLALNTNCRFCTASGPFYKRLTESLPPDKRVHLLAVFSQPVAEAHEYLRRLGVAIADVRELNTTAIPVAGTPTLLVVDQHGRVLKKWTGQIGPEQESEVFKGLGL